MISKVYLGDREWKGAGRAMRFCVTLELPSVPRSICTCTYRCDVGDSQLAKMEEN